jgi:4-amino-4-deoxy-L-arabinose transferase-like glycosyltransferase
MRAAIAVILVLIATLLLLAATIPTFDFDEALYRRVAEEMKQSHEYFVMTWDGKPFYEKPPTYIWSIVASSFLVDGSSPHVSVFASRLPSVICRVDGCCHPCCRCSLMGPGCSRWAARPALSSIRC